MEIQLTQGKVALIDDADAALVSGNKWHLQVIRQRGYVKTYAARARRPEDGPGVAVILMHRVLTGARQGQYVDHKNGDGLDNRRENIRACTPQQNAANAQRQQGSSGYRGVHKCCNKWRARISWQDTMISIGRFTTALEAAHAYDQKAKELFGEFATLNFPDDIQAA